MKRARARLSISELRSRTDRELVALIRNQFERSLKLARLGHWEEARSLSKQAEALLAVASAPAAVRAELESVLNSVRAALTPPQARVACAHSAWM